MTRSRIPLAALPLAIGLVGCQSASVVPATAADASPPQTTAVSASDLRALYADKTWLWQDGAGYFAPNGAFRAWSGSGAAASYATGSWWVNDRGGMCFDAAWHTSAGSKDAATCFVHRRGDAIWYQKREPAGPWYVFRSDPPKPEDEAAKLKGGDLVEGELRKTKAAVDAP